jgi:Mn2+/Fe2+ NRAMP family transporter
MRKDRIVTGSAAVHLSEIRKSKNNNNKNSFFSILRPTLITGASDDDPSSIVTYSQVGTQFGFGILWMVLFLYPLMTPTKEIRIKISLVTGNGLAEIIKTRYSRKTIYPIASLLLVANTINIDAMTTPVRLIFPQLPILVIGLSFTTIILLSRVLVSYEKYVKILRYLTLSLFAYVIATIIVGENLQNILTSTIVLHIEFSADFAMMFVAVARTTISLYLLF